MILGFKCSRQRILDNLLAQKPEGIDSLLEMHYLKTSVILSFSCQGHTVIFLRCKLKCSKGPLQVADMENQMIRLQQTVADDVKRRESECKRENNLERGFSNQVSRI